jgi:hypothetical protein
MSKKKSRPRTLTKSAPAAPALAPSSDLLADVRNLIEQARSATARADNAALALLYWQVGKRIRIDVLGEKRAEYGEQILPTLSAKLAPEYGQG